MGGSLLGSMLSDLSEENLQWTVQTLVAYSQNRKYHINLPYMLQCDPTLAYSETVDLIYTHFIFL